MIIRCQQCKESFTLDDAFLAKLPFKVRCSKCKDVFIAEKPDRAESVATLRPPLPQTKTSPDGRAGKVITICNQKGGVAKTTSCQNIGVSLALLKKRVLLVDFDAQSNLTMLFGLQQKRSFYDVLEGQVKLPDILNNPLPNLWLLPSSGALALLSKKYLQQQRFEYLLEEQLEPIRNKFDYILIDTPPSIEFLTINALTTSNLAIIPTHSAMLSMNGIAQIEKSIQAIRKKSRHQVDYKVLVTMFDRQNTASRVVHGKLKKHYQTRLFDSVIDQDAKVHESQIVRKPVCYYDRSSRSALQYMAVAKEIAALSQ